jgi:phosphoribosylpyrophosphate synthetase
VVLIHSTEDSENFLKLFLTLFALREEGVKTISLINTYQGYARQHKEREDAVGEGISAVTVLKVINNFLDNNLLDNKKNKKNNIAIDVHYGEEEGITSLEPEIFIFKDGKKIVINKLEPEEVFNLCGFVQLSEYLIKSIPLEEITEEHPLLLIAPDDGSYFYVEKAAEVLRQRYGLNVVAGFLSKKRKTAEEVTITKPGIYKEDENGNDVLLSFPELDKHWIIDLDDVTSTGGTILSSIYHLVRILGADWRKIYVGVDHWKVPEGSNVFDTGLNEEELKTAKLPKNIDDENKRMPPIRIITMATLPLPQGIESVSPATLISYAIKRILGKKAEALFVGDN